MTEAAVITEHTQIWLALIAIIPVTIASVTTAIMAYQNRLHSMKMYDLARDTHTLVNSNMGATLESYSVIAERLANYTDKPEDREAAAQAKLKYKEHVSQQAIVDKGRRLDKTPTDPQEPPYGDPQAPR